MVYLELLRMVNFICILPQFQYQPEAEPTGGPRPHVGETGHQESNCLQRGSPPTSDALSILLSPLLLSSLMRTQTSTEVEEQEVRP